jgi:hypothetical protein
MTGLALARALAGTAFAAVAGLALAQPYPNVPKTTDGTAQSTEDFHYGVCHGTDPSCYHNWGIQRPKKVLLFTRTAGPRHQSLGTALPLGLDPPLGPDNHTQADIIRLLNAEGIGVDYTETVTNLSNLDNYSAVIFFSNSRDVLWDHGRAVNPAFAVSTTTSAYLDQAKVLLRQYMRAGGGFVAIHNAHGTEYNWPWYEGLLGNSNYYSHGPFQLGTYHILTSDSSTAPIGPPGTAVTFTDEWYNLVPFPTDVKFLAAVDDSTLAGKDSGHPGFPNFHPIAWCQYYDGGRAWITTLGHDLRDTEDLATLAGTWPGAAEFQKLIVNGIKSAMGLQPFCTTYAFTGFVAPIVNAPGFNPANAGSSVRISFGLGGNQGTSPFTVTSAPISCLTGLPTLTGPIDPPTAVDIDYDGGSQLYHFNWKTQGSWANSCRELLVTVNDGTIRRANFQLRGGGRDN